ncbi:MAG: ribosomal RNA small subunit methyltransferase A [Candidatus Harrisonbacteria bacterium RIFCSPLOWO2_01_FULL_44_18]|uniref:Ribosomal RNA small subunit methyltransferase A n=1 Tax=Candidatus Harrisonbacteria bacterium RIFCSPLOWO2_01_FULL_44_18 TaxID=1798407 RepID=A0A1G1ZMI0_9BACT|nr:MAG: ribosomal RNA small subunit methyltransferase A [Candidatus Harrisonbacteria bacterium RIFCSPLOWO2_01_FULL_44_18]
MSKKLGQHFLINKAAIKKIIAALDLSPSGRFPVGGQNNDTIIEIGPGKGALTLPLVKQCQVPSAKCQVIAIEKDKALAETLTRKSVNSNWKLEIIEGDALKILPNLITNYRLLITDYKIVGNIPYYITGKLLRILGDLITVPSGHLPQGDNYKLPITNIVLTIQREVAERITAKPPRMNLLAAAIQFWAEPEIIGYLKPADFSPSPKVDSAIMKLTPKKITNYSRFFPKIEDPRSAILSESGSGQLPTTNYYQLIKIIFKQPRKTLLNNLAVGLKLDKTKALEIMKTAGLKGNERPQDLSLEKIHELLEFIYS